jgi:dTDP-glucose 4,6-dehydratase
MKLLVTGGAGFIGSNFIHYWLKKYPDDGIVNLDKLTYAGNLENLKGLSKNSNYKFIKGDICDPDIVKRAMDGVDIVVHFAAESHVDRSIDDPSIFVRTNVLGTQVLLEEALRAKVNRFHHVSTDEVFGALKLKDSTKWTESTPYAPRSPYAASKAASDHLVRSYHITYGLPITITNCSNNFGPFQYPEKLISLSITNILEGKKIPVYGDGLYIRDWLYVEDHCSGIEAVLIKGKVGETYLIGAKHEEISNLELAKIILKTMGVSEEEKEFVKDRPGHDRKYALDWSKIKDELGWEPKYDFKEALEKTIKWYKENKEWWKALK